MPERIVDDMGTFRIDFSVASQLLRDVTLPVTNALVDTGSEASWIPAAILESLGVPRLKRAHYRQASGTIVERWTGPVVVYAAGTFASDDVVFAEPGDLTLLGARTLEGLNVTVDPIAKRLRDAGPAPAAGARFALTARAAALLAMIALSAPGADAQQPGFSDPARLAKLRAALPAVDSIMRRFTEQQHIPGAAWGVVVDGKVMHIGVTGLRDVDAKSPVDSNTVFRIASMTKSFTALAILKLRDDGKLALDDPAEKYVPEMRSLKYPTTDSPKITIRHLLSHAEGFPEDNPWGDQQLARSEAELSRMIAGGIPFSNTPGVAYEYSNYGFAILGRIVTRASGMPYNEYITANILRPLGMRSTTYSPTSVAPNRLAHGYRWEDERWKEEPQLPDGSFGSMGGMLTSIADLSQWVSVFLGAWPPRDGAETGHVRRSSVREMQQVWRPAPTSASRDAAGNIRLNVGGYAYGLRVSTNCLFAHIVAHSGGLPGFGSQMRWLPEYGVGIIAFGNRTYAGWGPPIDAAFEAFARTGAFVPRMAEPSAALTSAREQVTKLVLKWDAGLAQSLAADNLFLDRAADRRASEIAAHLNRVGACKAPAGFAYVENALRGQWILECERGNLLVAITLAPTMPPTVQYLEVTPAPAGGAAALRPKTCS